MSTVLIDAFDWVFRSAVLFGAVAVLCRAGGNRLSAAGRFNLWLATAGLMLLTPIAMSTIPGAPWANSLIGTSDETAIVEAAENAGPTAQSVEESFISPIQSAVKETVPFSPWIAAWILGTCMMGMRFVISHISLRAQARAGGAGTPRQEKILLPFQKDLKRVRVTFSPTATNPMAWGIIHPTITLPCDAIDWSEERLHLVLRHELAHIRRHDLLWLNLVEAALVPGWFNPFLWLAAARMKREREFATDDRVLANGARPSLYAQMLCSSAGGFRDSSDLQVAIPMASRAGFMESRVERTLDATIPRTSRGLVALAVAVPVGFALLYVGSRLLNAPVPPSLAGEQEISDGFDYPVGGGKGTGYYVYRGFTANKHLGEDWNGVTGGDADFGDPVLSIGDGKVVFAEDVKKGWGNVVIISHQYRDRKTGEEKTVESLYGHLKDIRVKNGDRVKRGQRIGSIGRGPKNMYHAHLHFEIRKIPGIGLDRHLFPRDYSHYFSPRSFIAANRP